MKSNKGIWKIQSSRNIGNNETGLSLFREASCGGVEVASMIEGNNNSFHYHGIKDGERSCVATINCSEVNVK
jgi:hypothetical protein